MSTLRAAGILFLTPDKRALFVQRSAEGDHAGEWCLPGGKVEDGETLEEAARREANEEIGKHPAGELLTLTRTRSFADEVAVPAATSSTAVGGPPLAPAVEVPGVEVDFTTFAQQVDKEFEVKLNPEHTAFTWAPLSSPPQPLHPGVATAVARLSMNELDIAEAIRDGRIVSGQRFHGMALHAMRVTGTGVAYRRGRKEYVFRKPELYLNERFLQRCNGLPVIMEHPEKKLAIDGEEFQERAVGTIFLPYIVGDEVWAIVKIYDNTTIKMLETSQLSTSPSVVFRDPSTTNQRLRLDDGSVILVEGEPSLLDHLAICLKGVWDKGGEPRGVAFETYGDNDMTEEEKKAAEAAQAKKDADEAAAAEQAKKDADAGTKLDKVLGCLDSLTKRMDAWDEANDKAKKDAEEAEAAKKRADGDAEQAAKDKAKKDADEAEEKAKAEKDRKDAEEDRAKKDAETRASIQALADALPKVLSDDDLNAMADAQSRADSVFTLFGKSAPRPLPGEGLLQYRRRNAVALKVHSAAYKDADLSVIPDTDAGKVLFDNIEKAIYNDAEVAGRNPVDIPVDVLRTNVRVDDTGRRVTSFQGHPSAWMGQFSGHRRRLSGIRNS